MISRRLRTWIGILSLAVLAVACSSPGVEVPPVSETPTGQRLPGKILWRDLLTDAPQQSMAFYRELFGWEFEPVGGGVNYTLIRHRGRLIGGLVDQNQLPAQVDISQWVVIMSVADIDTAAAATARAGGTVLTPPTSLGARGDIAVITDSQGALMGLLQTRQGDPLDGVGETAQGDFLWDELWTVDVDEAGEFLATLAPFGSESMALGTDGAPVQYQLLSSGGMPRAGIRSRPDEAIEPTWLSYLRVQDEGTLQRLVAQVESLGGKVLVPATQRPRGGSVALVTDPSGAAIALQTWSEQQQAAKEAGL